MNRKLIVPALLSIAMQACAVYAQTIEFAEPYVLGTPLVVTVADLPEGSRLLWENGGGVSELLPVNQTTFHGWVAKTGDYPFSVIVAPPEGPLRKAVRTLHAVDAPPKPNPPQPAPTLAALAGDKAPALAKLYRELLDALDDFDDLGHFRSTEAAGLTKRGLTGHGAAAAIAGRLNVSSIDKLAVALTAVVNELGAPGPTPPVVPGKRHVVILHETAEQTPEQARLFNDLRTGPAAAELVAAGHTLDILDDELRPDLSGVLLPALYVLDPATKAVLYSQPLPATAAEVVKAVK